MLDINIDNNQLTITISHEGLKCSLESGRLDMLIGGTFKLCDMKTFLSEYKTYLLQEEEDGSTPVHIMFDEVAALMLENTDEGCEVID